jgi:sugar transferase (PEP-CTERM/EpsH1 system associated)
MAPVRVMHIVYELGLGGMELGVAKLANGADRARVEVSVCSCRPIEGNGPALAPQVPLFALNRRHGNDLGLVRRLASLFRREHPDIVHTHAWGTLCEGVMAAKFAGVPFVVHGEHGTMETKPHNLWVQRQVWRRVDRVLAVSSRLADRMASQTGFPRERIGVIRNGVDLGRFGRGDSAGVRRALGLPQQDVFIVGTVGRLVPVKDQHGLLKAVAAMRSNGVPCIALLAGDGPLKEELERHAHQLGIRGHVLFLGARKDVADLMLAVDVFVLPSRSEGLSNTILEAMASGRPVVATDVGGNSELVNDGVTGRLIPAEAPEALAAALSALHREPETRLAMGRAGRLRAEREFSLEGMISSYQDLYLGLAQDRKVA